MNIVYGKKTYYIKEFKSSMLLEKYLNTCTLKEIVSKDEYYANKYEAIIIEGEEKFGIGLEYYDVGLNSSILALNRQEKIICGFDSTVLIIDTMINKVIFQYQTSSLIYTIMYCFKLDKAIVIQEMGITIIDTSGKIIFKSDFRDIIIDYNFIDDTDIYIMCEDGFEVKYAIKDII